MKLDVHLTTVDSATLSIVTDIWVINGVISIYSRQVEEASEHFIAFLDGRDAPVVGTTYRAIQDTVQQIIDCGYFSRVSGITHQKTAGQQDEVLPCSGNI
jgi:arginine deiminase